MDLAKISEILKEKYEAAKQGEMHLTLHLFGIEYADVISKADYSANDIGKEVGLKNGGHAEISKGIKLAKYVVLK